MLKLDDRERGAAARKIYILILIIIKTYKYHIEVNST